MPPSAAAEGARLAALQGGSGRQGAGQLVSAIVRGAATRG
jgi:hypothetical protein